MNNKIRKSIYVLIKNKILILKLAAFGLLLGIVVSLILPKHYKSTSRVVFDLSSYNNTFIKNNGSLKFELDKIKSQDFLLIVAEDLSNNQEFTKYPLYKIASETNKNDSKGSIENLAASILSSIEVEEDIPASALTITAITNNPNECTDISNAIAKEFKLLSIMNNRKLYLSYLVQLQKRQSEIQSEIQKALTNYQQYIALGSTKQLSPNSKMLIEQIAELESELENIEIENLVYTDKLKILQTSVKNSFPKIEPSEFLVNNFEYNMLKVALERNYVESSLINAIKNFGNRININYPWTPGYFKLNSDSLLIEFNNKIDNILNEEIENNILGKKTFIAQIKKIEEIQSKLNSIDITKSILYDLITGLEDKFNLIPFENIELARLSRTNEFYGKLDSKIKSAMEKLKKEINLNYALVDSITEGLVPKTYFSPNIFLNILLLTILGLLIGIIYSFYKTKPQFDLVSSIDDLESAGYKIISQIPNFKTEELLISDINKNPENSKFVFEIEQSFERIESFLLYGNLEKELKTILVTSPLENEGKSVVAANASISLAQNGKKVLLVDINLKKPVIHKYFKLKSNPSIAHYLFRKKELDEIIRVSLIQNLDLITSIEFPQNPSVIVKSERLKNFVELIKQRYDYVIFDSSSLCDLKELTEIAQIVDITILVVRANQTKISDLKKAEELIKSTGVTNINIVLNSVSYT